MSGIKADESAVTSKENAMSAEIPEALAVLDLIISAYLDGNGAIEDQRSARKARAAFAAEHEALKCAVDNPDDNAYWIKQAQEALAAMEKIK